MEDSYDDGDIPEVDFPMNTPIARSTTFPRNANSLNSLKNCFIFSSSYVSYNNKSVSVFDVIIAHIFLNTNILFQVFN